MTFEEIIENTFVTENYRLRALLSKGKTELCTTAFLIVYANEFISGF